MLRLPVARAIWAALMTAFAVAALAPSTATAQPSPPLPQDNPALADALTAVDSLRDAGAFRDAFARLSSLKNDHPGNANVLYRLALTRVDMGEQLDSESQRTGYYKDALTDAKAAVEADSVNAYAHLSRAVAEGRVALTAGTKEKIRRSRAVKHHTDRAIELDADLAAAYHVRARWNREVADLGFFERTIVKTVYGGLPEASFEQAVSDFQTAIELEDKIVHRLELARTYEKMDQEAKARQELQLVLDMPPTDPDDPRHKEEARELMEDIG